MLKVTAIKEEERGLKVSLLGGANSVEETTPAVQGEGTPSVVEEVPAEVEEVTPAEVEEVSPAVVEEVSPAVVEEATPAVVEEATPAVVVEDGAEVTRVGEVEREWVAEVAVVVVLIEVDLPICHFNRGQLIKTLTKSSRYLL